MSPDDVVKELLDKSYTEILNKLTKKKTQQLTTFILQDMTLIEY